MKRVILFFLVIIITFSSSGCGSSKESKGILYDVSKTLRKKMFER